jgi:hypothetical protein
LLHGRRNVVEMMVMMMMMMNQVSCDDTFVGTLLELLVVECLLHNIQNAAARSGIGQRESLGVFISLRGQKVMNIARTQSVRPGQIRRTSKRSVSSSSSIPW